MRSVRLLLQSILFGLFFCGLTNHVVAGELEDRRFDKQITQLFGHYQIDYEGKRNDALLTLENGRFQFWYLMGLGVQTSPINFPIEKINTEWSEDSFGSDVQTKIEHHIYFDGRTYVYVRTETAPTWKTVEERVLRPHEEGLGFEHRQKYFRQKFPFSGTLVEDTDSREALANTRNQKFVLRPIKKGLISIDDFYAAVVAQPNFGNMTLPKMQSTAQQTETRGTIINLESARTRRMFCEDNLKPSLKPTGE